MDINLKGDLILPKNTKDKILKLVILTKNQYIYMQSHSERLIIAPSLQKALLLKTRFAFNKHIMQIKVTEVI